MYNLKFKIKNFNLKNYYSFVLLSIFFGLLNFNNTYCMQSSYNQANAEQITKKQTDDLNTAAKKTYRGPEKQVEEPQENLSQYFMQKKRGPKQVESQIISKEPVTVAPETKDQEILNKKRGPKEVNSDTKTGQITSQYFHDMFKNLIKRKVSDSTTNTFQLELSFDKKDLNTKQENLKKNKSDIFENSSRLTLISPNKINDKILGNTQSPIAIYLKPTIKESLDALLSAYNPELCLLGECDCTPRSVRDQFEKKVVNLEKINNLQIKDISNINYLGFSPGDLFSDLKILSDLILNKNKKINTIHLVDAIYNNNSMHPFSGRISEIQTSMYQNYSQAFLRVAQLALFVKLLSEFQGQPILLIIYENINSYIEKCKNDSSKMANLATMIDLENKYFTTEGNSLADNEYKILNNGLQKEGALCTLIKYDEYSKKNKYITIKDDKIHLQPSARRHYTKGEEGTYEAITIKKSADGKFLYTPEVFKEEFYVKP